jgi:hypothetical protein
MNFAGFMRVGEWVFSAIAAPSNESAKMATGKGVVQGYTGVATVDEKAQIIVDAQAIHKAKPDPLWDKTKKGAKPTRCFTPDDFQLADDQTHCLCPAGKRLYSNGSNCTLGGNKALKFSGAQQDCVPCERRNECLRTPEKTKTRQVTFLQGKRGGPSETDKMKAKIDADMGRAMITRRFATVEPVFGNIRGNKRLHRFTLRGRTKVDGQWKLYCLMHNIEKLAHHGYAA